MPIDTWFPLAIYYEDVQDSIEHKMSLLSAIFQLEEAVQERRNFPEMAWTGDLHGVHNIHQNPQFSWVVGQVEKHVVIYLKALGIDLAKIKPYIQRAWPVISRHQQEVGMHSHNTAHVSAVYYVAVPLSGSDEAGCLAFVDDARMNEVSPGLGSENTDVMANWTPFNQEQALYAPVEGRLMVFPAKQRHGVTLNHTEAPRVSLSFDIVLTAAVGVSGAYEFLTPPIQLWRPFSDRAEE
ncbi:TIGR02466 family protein [Oscillatoria sp. CS-180]|uniref:TIGR02466 family protein n=1 Tax=Oscillatoria sp. CS-180 TaxID=3021720 RepID=UPI0023307401|nr:TIGR02466 family protein [Oscillatoria sp. CS-180]MDB9529048.1 TIGR02466 family protein [Oscillatoria sp. CS-180]